MSKETKVPTIHLNGTSAKSLQEDLQEAYSAVGVAMEALHKTAPNGRDYYVQEDGAFRVAQAQYFERLNALNTVRSELLAIFEGIDKQIQQREVSRA